MDALFSGQAGTLAIVQGADVRVQRKSGVEYSIPREGLSYLFGGCNDVVLLLGATEEVARQQSERAWAADRALRLMLIAIDPEDAADLRGEAADYLDEFLEDDFAKAFIENELYARALPTEIDLDFIDGKWPRALAVLQDILRQQEEIRKYREAWDQLGAELFDKIEKN